MCQFRLAPRARIAAGPAAHNYQFSSTTKIEGRKELSHWKQAFIFDFSPSHQRDAFLDF